MNRRRIVPRLREAAAMARQARYLSYDLASRIHLGSGPSVVLLHGLYASAGVFRPLRQRLQRELDASLFSFSYVPGPGVVELTERIGRLISRIEAQRPIHLVGHSLGGLVIRNYARWQDSDPRIAQTISLAAPFLGSRRNWLVPGQAGRDLDPDSPLLRELCAVSPENERVLHTTIVAQDDEMILPGAYPPFGRHVLIERVGHNGILFHDETLRVVVESIRRAEERTQGGTSHTRDFAPGR